MSGEATVPLSYKTHDFLNYCIVNDSSYSEQLELCYEAGGRDFVIFVSANNGGIPKSHPYYLKKELNGCINDHQHIQECKFTNNGNLLIITKNRECASQALRINKICGVETHSRLQMEKITSRFLLHDIPTEVELEELAAELSMNGINCSEIRRFTRKVKNIVTPTETVLVTSFGTYLPPEVKLWYMIQKISTFIDNPRQCGRCYKFNHGTRSCKSAVLCIKCGGEHDFENCSSNTTKCCNCNGDHRADSKSCPVRKEEEMFLKFKCTNRLPFNEARRQYNKNKLAAQDSYSAVTSSRKEIPPRFITEEKMNHILANQAAQIHETLSKFISAQTEVFTSALKEFQNTIFNEVKNLIKISKEQDTPNQSSPVQRKRKERKNSQVTNKEIVFRPSNRILQEHSYTDQFSASEENILTGENSEMQLS